jgi:hypothetical protein
MPLGGKLAVTEVALVITVSEPGRNLSQASPPDRLTAKRTVRMEGAVSSD